MGSRSSKGKDKNLNSSTIINSTGQYTSNAVRTREDGTPNTKTCSVTPSSCTSTDQILKGCDSTTTTELLLASSQQTLEMEDSSHRVILTENSCCRICHEGSSIEELISPCYCSGTVGKMHLSCLERWLQVTHRSQCELCSYNFPVERIPKSLRQFLMNPGSNTEFANLVCDVTCFLVLTPLLGITIILCTRGVKYYDAHGKTGSMFAVVTLILSLVIVYLSWAVLAFLYHYRIWKVWRENTAEIRMSPEKYGRPKKKQQQDEKSTLLATPPTTAIGATTEAATTTMIHCKSIVPQVTYPHMPDSSRLTKDASLMEVNNGDFLTNTVELENPHFKDPSDGTTGLNYFNRQLCKTDWKSNNSESSESGLHKTTMSVKMETTV